MRRVSLGMLTSDMKLGRAVLQGTNVLIREGTTHLDRFVSRLEKIGISSLIIDDKVGQGIELNEVISDKMRGKCRRTLDSTFKKLKTDFSIDQAEVVETVEGLLEEIIAKSSMLISLNEIGGIADNTLDHSVNVTVFAVCLGMQLGYGTDKMAKLAEGSLLHDIGKTMLDDRILFKPGKLDQKEFEYIKTHTELGYSILEKTSGLSEITRRMALYHHERLDGSGYPFGISGDEVPDYARVVAIADVYEALTADRCYHRAVSPQKAVEIMMEESASKLDLEMTTAFLQNVAVYPNGTMVRLSDNGLAVVKTQNASMPMRPVIRRIYMEGMQQIGGETIDLMKVLNLTILDE